MSKQQNGGRSFPNFTKILAINGDWTLHPPFNKVAVVQFVTFPPLTSKKY